MIDHEPQFADLPQAERALLWAMRLWVIGHCRQQDVSDRLGAALSDLGAASALGYLEGFMWALNRGAARPIQVLCLCRTEVSADERLLLGAFALLQQDEPHDAFDLLCGLMAAQAATVAVGSAEQVARRFLAAGMALPWQQAVASVAQVLH